MVEISWDKIIGYDIYKIHVVIPTDYVTQNFDHSVYSIPIIIMWTFVFLNISVYR